MTIKLRTLAMILGILLVLAASGTFLFVYLGTYNVASTQEHTRPVYQLLHYAMNRAVKLRSNSVDVPDLSGEQRRLNGAALYHQHCLQCHGAPGVSPHDLAFGMTPKPVNLVAASREWAPSEIYWVIRHGIKMTGMPAWEYRIRDEEIWDIVAFIKVLPILSPADYAALNSRLPKPQEGKGQSKEKLHENKAAIADQALARPYSMPSTLGNVKAGKGAIEQYLCATCHEIPGIVGASHDVGPPLKGIAGRRYIAGILVNNSENMVRWLMDPHQFAPNSAMPNLGVTEKDARDIAAYLYTLDHLN